MNENEERAYMRGQQAVYSSLLGLALRHLEAEDLSRERLIKERTDAIAILRRLCEDHGDNDWPDDLHLADIIDKHLGDHLSRQ